MPMERIHDDDLVLYAFGDLGEAARARIEYAVQTDADVRARLQRLEEALALADDVPAPVADEALAARVWQSLEPRIAAPARLPWRERIAAWLDGFAPPRLALGGLAACALAVAIGAGFLAGRHTAPEPDAIAQQRADDAARRVLDAYVAAHLRASEGVLVTASNTGSPALLDGNRELAAGLVESNRLYARAAERAGDLRLATFLRQLEPVLVSLANRAPPATVQPDDGLRDYLRETDLLFEMRATQARLEQPREHRT